MSQTAVGYRTCSKEFFNTVRTGIALYGHYPSLFLSRSMKLKAVMTFKTFVANISEIPVGSPISYGRKWVSEKDTQDCIATCKVWRRNSPRIDEQRESHYQ